MPEGEKDYSDFVRRFSNSSYILSIFAGFTFTALVIFVTGFSDLSPIAMQAMLLLLNFLLLLFILLMLWIGNRDLYYIKNIHFCRGGEIYNLLNAFGVCMLGLVLVFLFVYLNQIALALASLVMWVVFVVCGYLFIMKPYIELKKKH